MKILSNIFKENITSQRQRGTNNFSKSKKQDDSLFDFLELLKKWHDIIGHKISKVTEPVKISNKKLIIYTAHSAFSQQLSMMQNQIISKIKEIYPAAENKIKALSFVTKDKHFNNNHNEVVSEQATKEYQKNNKLNKFSPTYRQHLAQANKLFEDIEDPSIKESLTKIFITSKDS